MHAAKLRLHEESCKWMKLALDSSHSLQVHVDRERRLRLSLAGLGDDPDGSLDMIGC